MSFEKTKFNEEYKKLPKTDIEGNTCITDRSIEEYKQTLGITEKDLRGKKVLDIGSGIAERFAKEAKMIDADVYSINPSLKEESGRQALVEDNKNWTHKSVAARGQNLPFKENMFDTVIALFSVSYYVSYEDFIIVLKGVMRILKPGGTFFVGPFTTWPFLTSGIITGDDRLKLEEFLQQNNYTYAEKIYVESDFSLQITKN